MVNRKKLSAIIVVFAMALALQGCAKTTGNPDPVAALEIFNETENAVTEASEAFLTEFTEETEFDAEEETEENDYEDYSETEGEYREESAENVCYLSVSCETILNNYDLCDSDKWEIVPEDGVILHRTEVEFTPGESVFDVLQRVCRDNGIHMESEWTPMYNSAYIEGIYNLYEFDVGSDSGWMYQVNGWFPNFGCSQYAVEAGDEICWQYTCNMGRDIGGSNALG